MHDSFNEFINNYLSTNTCCTIADSEYSWKETCSTPFHYYIYGKIKEGILNKIESDSLLVRRIEDLKEKLTLHSQFQRGEAEHDPMQFLHYFQSNSMSAAKKDYDKEIEEKIVSRIMKRQWSLPDKPWGPTVDIVEESRDNRFISNCKGSTGKKIKCKHCDKVFENRHDFTTHLWSQHQKASERTRQVWDDDTMHYVSYTEQWIPPNDEMYEQLSRTYRYHNTKYQPNELVPFEKGSWQPKSRM